MGLPSQVIEKSVLKVFKRKFVDRYSNSLLNIALGIYGKLGYSAWELSKPIESTDYFIGIDIKPIYENNWVISVHTFNNRGNWLNCRLGRSEPGYLDKLSKMLNDVTRNFEKDVENLVIHREGTPPTKDEFAVYLEALKNYKIEVLWTHKESYVRAYNIRNPKFAVEKGICTKIDDNRFIIFTFITPHGTSSPLMFRKITSHKRKRDFLEQAYEIFILTSVNTGRIFPMTLRPVTTHYANKTSRLFASGVKPLEKGLWFL
jgi:argonaute-like protein implicated in RNA metabolism and viral defense